MDCVAAVRYGDVDGGKVIICHGCEDTMQSPVNVRAQLTLQCMTQWGSEGTGQNARATR